jgi:hypothetical protein
MTSIFRQDVFFCEVLFYLAVDCCPKCNQRTDAPCSRKCYMSGCQYPKSEMSTESVGEHVFGKNYLW